MLLIFFITTNVTATQPYPPAPQKELIYPGNMTVVKDVVDFIYDFNDLENDIAFLKFDILGPPPYDLPATKIQATFAANESDPLYGLNSSERALLEDMGVSVTYDADTETWTMTIDTNEVWNNTNKWSQPIGSPVWPAGIYDFYIEVLDASGNKWGNAISPPNYAHYVYSFHEIQPLIDIASGGDVLTVLSGEYRENLLISTANIVLQGVSHPVIDGAGSTVIYVNADNVTIDGFDIINASDSDGDEMGIYYDTVSQGTIKNNNIHFNNHGIYILDSNNITIAYNNISLNWIPTMHSSYADCTHGGIGIFINSTTGGIGNYHHLIDHNKIHQNHRQGIYLGALAREGDDSSITKYNVISYNKIYDNGLAWAICSGFPGGSGDEYGIHLSAADENKIGPGNEIYDHNKWSQGAGIYLDLSRQNTIVSNIDVFGADVPSVGGILSNSRGIVLYQDSTDNEIFSNDIKNNDYGIRIYDGSSTTDSGPGTLINFNNIQGNTQYGIAYGLGGAPSVTINATFNWWGNYTGPHHPVTNPTGTGDEVSDDVDYANYLTVDWYNLVWVDNYYDPSTPGWGVTHFATITDGMNAVFETGVVVVKPGTYEEVIRINKSLTIRSSFGSQVTTITDDGATYSEMEKTNGQTIFIATSNVVIDGLHIERFEYTSYHPVAGIGNIGAPGVKNITVRNCWVESLYNGTYFSQVDGLTLFENTYDGQPDDTIIFLDKVKNFIIENNTLDDYNLRGIYLGNCQKGRIFNNSIDQKSYIGFECDHCSNITINGSGFVYDYDTAIRVNCSKNIRLTDLSFKHCQYGIIVGVNSTVFMLNNTFSDTNHHLFGAVYVDDIDLYYGDVQDAVNHVGAGSDVMVYPGNYHENIVIEKPVTIIGVIDASQVVIEGGNTSSTILIAPNEDVKNVEINGVTITGGHHCIQTGRYHDVSGLTIKNCIIQQPDDGYAVFIDPHDYSDVPPIRNGTDLFSTPVLLQGNVIRDGVYYRFWSHELYGVEIDTQLIVLDNDIDEMFMNGSIAVQIEGNDFYSLGMMYSSDVVIERNVFENPWETRYGIYLWSINGTPPVKNVKISHNTISGYSSFAVSSGISGQGIVVAGAMDVEIKNNEIRANSDGIWITEDYINRNGERCLGDVLDITISENDIENGQTGIKLLDNVNGTLITDNTIQINGKGIWVHGSDDHIIANNSIFGNYYGIRFDEGSSNNLVYNNYFADNFISAYDHHSTTNRWNISLTHVTNIMGGPYTGGNYWDDYIGDDTNGDGIGDENLPYNASGEIVHGGDYLPLVFVDPIPPEVTVIYPNGGEVVNGTVIIQWMATDNVDPDLSIDIEYSNDAGATWHIISPNVENTGSYAWNTSSLPEGTDYLIRVTATDTAGNQANDTSDGTFSIYIDTPGPEVTITNPLIGYLYFFNEKKIRFLNNNCFAIGHLIIEAETSTLLSIEKVEFYIDDELVYTDYTGDDGVYSWRWDEPVMFYHDVKVIAYDVHGGMGYDTIGVTMFNFNLIP